MNLKLFAHVTRLGRVCVWLCVCVKQFKDSMLHCVLGNPITQKEPKKKDYGKEREKTIALQAASCKQKAAKLT